MPLKAITEERGSENSGKTSQRTGHKMKLH